MRKFKVLIVDDEPLARDIIRSYLKEDHEIEISAECENGFEALQSVQKYKPDFIFLDIQMPKINGFELLEVLDEKPPIIFTTAFDQYAIKAFELNAVDYLLKPFSRERFGQAVLKMKELLSSSRIIQPGLEDLKQHVSEERQFLERVVVRHLSKIVVIPVDKIWYFEAQDDYVRIVSEAGNFLKDKTMKYFEEHLPTDDFIRIHRSHLVAVHQIESSEQYAKDVHVVHLRCGAKLKTSAQGYKRLREIF